MTLSFSNLLRSATLATGLAVSATWAMASPVTIGGITVGGIGETTLIGSDLTENFVSPENPHLFGFGKVNQINGLTGSNFCASSGCELTYVFRNYFPVAFDSDGSQSSIVFTGGTVDFYVDSTPDATLERATGFDDSDTGIPWLSLIGYETTSSSSPWTGLTGTLFSSATNLLDPANISGSGIGYLEVVGGDAAGHFGIGTVMSFTSTNIEPSPAGWALPLADPADLEVVARGTPTQIPEPGTLALAGLGILALGMARLRGKMANQSL